MIQAALGKREEIVVYGTDFATKDGSAVRDYIHVQDLADAHVLALQHLLAKSESFAVNLGTGVGYSILELVNYIQKRTTNRFRVRLEKSRPGEPGALVASARKAAESLGWAPKHSALDTIIDSAWKWHQRW
jgi:UDP-glucose 4-epimerase